MRVAGKRGLCAGLLLFATLAMSWEPPAAFAQRGRAGVAAARERYRKGIKLYDLGRFEEAIKEFEAAYEKHEDPSYLFNLAQAHRRAGNDAQALELYKNYLRKVPNAPDRAQVEEHIAALERAAAPLSPPPPQTPLPQPEPAAPAPASPTAGPPPADPSPRRDPVMPAPDAAGSGANGTRVAAWVVGAAGLVAVGGGIYFGLDARSKQDRALTGDSYDPQLEEEAKSARTKQYVFLAAGGAGLVASGVLFLLSSRDRDAAAAAVPRFSVAVDPSSAVIATFSGRFF